MPNMECCNYQLTIRHWYELWVIINVQAIFLQLGARKTNSLDEGFLRNEEDGNNRQGYHERCRHQVCPLHIICSAEKTQSKLQRVK